MNRKPRPIQSDKEEEFLLDHEEILADFVRGDEPKLSLPPMNAFYRRLVHNLAGRFDLESISEGEDKDRHITLIRTSKTRLPSTSLRKPQRVWDFGDREFLVDPLQPSVDVVLLKDGTISLSEEHDGSAYITRKLVTTGSFKIKGNKIVEITDSEW